MDARSADQPELKSRNLLIDTSIFYSANFDFQSKSFAALASAIQGGRAHLYLSPVTRKEVRRHILTKVREAAVAGKKFRQQASILWNVREPAFQAVFTKWSETAVLKKLLKQFQAFIKATDARMIPLEGASVGDVFNAYFAIRSPFEARADKRNEFPDAFVVSSALSWCVKTDQSIYVVSSDKGMCEACTNSKHLHALPSIEAFLDLLTRHDNRFADLANQVYDRSRGEILNIIEQEFTAAGFVLADQDGDVNDVQIERTTIGNAFLLSASERSAIFDVKAEIRFTADVSYADMDTAIYDSEEKSLIPTRYIGRSTKPQEQTVSFEIVLEFDPDNHEGVEVGCNSVNNGNDIEVLVDVNNTTRSYG